MRELGRGATGHHSTIKHTAAESAWYDPGDIGRILEKIGETQLSKLPADRNLDDYVREKCIIYLRFLIRRLWSRIDKVLDLIPNPMLCYADISGPRIRRMYFDNTPSKCPGSRIECQIKQFFAANRDVFKAILDQLGTLEGADEETERRKHALKEILRLLPYGSRSFSNHQPNVRLCWSSGDAIIAVGAPSGSVILNNNPKHMDDVCSAAGRVSRTYMTRPGVDRS